MKRNLKKKKYLIETVAKLEEMEIDEAISIEPTEWLIVLNCSFDSNIDGPTLESIFNQFQGFKKVEMFLGAKSYSYVQFQDSKSAAKVVDQLDGFRCEIVDKVILLAYAKTIPEFHPRPIVDPKMTVPGLELIPDFLDSIRENHLISTIEKQERWELLNKRSVQQYGYRFDYPMNSVDKSAVDVHNSKVVLPSWCDSLLETYLELYPDAKRPEQLTLNRYIPGDGISFHTDTHSSFQGPILILSLGSSIVMDFKSVTGQIVSVVLPARSLLVMDGEARYGWQHCIRARKVDLIDGKVIKRGIRTSLTFRTVRVDPCDCEFKELCV